MAKESRLRELTTQIEWRWTLAQALWGIPAALASFALPAWAVSATRAFELYSPASWVAAGFLGLLTGASAIAVVASARVKWVRSRYDARMLAIGGAVDPLEKTFERKRIYLGEFSLPSHPFIRDKSFIDCEIVGPANILLLSGNSINQGQYPISDAVYLKEGALPNNSYLFQDCAFKGCYFSRITFLVPYGETGLFRNYSLVKWITDSPYDQEELPLKSIDTDEP